MPPLICSFASHRSPPARLARWIAHLEALRRQYPDDTGFQETVTILLRRARQARASRERRAVSE